MAKTIKVRATVEFSITSSDLSLAGTTASSLIDNLVTEVVKVKSGEFENLIFGDIVSAEIVPTQTRGKAAGK